MPASDRMEQIERYVDRHPELASLANRLDADGRINRDFLAAYDKSNVPSAKKSLILRLALDDPRLTGKEPDDWNALGESVATLLEYRSIGPQAHRVESTHREQIPKHLYGLYDIPTRSPGEFVNAFALQPFWATLQGEPAGNPSDHLKYVWERFFRGYLLSEDIVREHFATSDYARTLSAYFETSLPALNVLNATTFIAVALRERLLVGRMQNKIPVALSNALGTARLSIPELEIYRDLARLALNNCLIDDAATVLPSPSQKLIESLGQLRSAFQTLKGFTELPELSRLVVTRYDYADFIPVARGEQKPLSKVTTSLRYNTTRLLARDDGYLNLAAFRPIYEDAIDHAALLSTLYREARDTAPKELQVEISKLISAAVKNHDGIARRDAVNVGLQALYQEHEGFDRGERLPSMARYFLGANDPGTASTGKRKPASGKRRSTTTQDRSYQVDPALVDGLFAAKPVFALYPSYRGDLPEGRILVPRAIADGYTSVPQGVELVGRATVRWGKDPYDALPSHAIPLV